MALRRRGVEEHDKIGAKQQGWKIAAPKEERAPMKRTEEIKREMISWEERIAEVAGGGF